MHHSYQLKMFTRAIMVWMRREGRVTNSGEWGNGFWLIKVGGALPRPSHPPPPPSQPLFYTLCSPVWRNDIHSRLRGRMGSFRGNIRGEWTSGATKVDLRRERMGSRGNKRGKGSTSGATKEERVDSIGNRSEKNELQGQRSERWR